MEWRLNIGGAGKRLTKFDRIRSGRGNAVAEGIGNQWILQPAQCEKTRHPFRKLFFAAIVSFSRVIGAGPLMKLLIDRKIKNSFLVSLGTCLTNAARQGGGGQISET